MTRDEVIEAMAIANWNAVSDPRNQWGTNPLNTREERHYLEGMSIALSALEAMGLAIVPVEPTEEMRKSGFKKWHFAEDVYRAMLSASPLNKPTKEGE